MPLLHVFLDLPASNELTKTELDIGIVTKPYVDVAHCIRAGFCISHALREWVRITIGFATPQPYSLTLDPTTLRYLGTDERSILHIILRAQESHRYTKTKLPYGVTISEDSVYERLAEILNQNVLLLVPNDKLTLNQPVSESQEVIMYCPLFEAWDKNLSSPQMAFYPNGIPRDVAVLEVVHTLDP